MLGIISDSYPSANSIEIINENILWSALFLSALWIGIIIVICIMIIYRYQFKNIVYIILLVNILFSLTYCTIANIYVYNKINYFIQNHNPNSIMYIDLDTLRTTDRLHTVANRDDDIKIVVINLIGFAVCGSCCKICNN